MDIKQALLFRQEEVNTLNSSYEQLKKNYDIILNAAIHETDPEKQKQNIQALLETNAMLSELVRDLITEISKSPTKVDGNLVNELTDELVKYQTQYNQITNSTNKTQTLKVVAYSNKNQLQNAQQMFNIYLAVLCCLIVFVAFLAIRSNFTGFTISAPTATPVVGGFRK